MKKRVIGDLNPKEKRVLSFMAAGVPETLGYLAKVAYGHQRPRAKGNSTVRNCMRKLVKLGKVKQVGRGTYVRPVAPSDGI
jgi:hypothetical protein